jgi:hypothetical protein
VGAEVPNTAHALRERFGAGVQALRPLPASGPLGLPAAGAVVVASTGAEPVRLALEAGQREELRQFVARGGRLLLLGYAAVLAHDLGLARERPRSEAFRWGYDAAARSGHARLGGAPRSASAAELFAGLPVVDGGAVLWAGGRPCHVPCCVFAGDPGGEVMAHLAVEREGSLAVETAAVAVQWPLERGAVLALGVPPDAPDDDGALADPARQLARNAVRWLGGAALVLVAEVAAAPAPSVPPVSLPHAAQLAHWGWQMPWPGRSVAVAALVDDVVLPASRAGADLFALEVADAGGLGVPWAAGDRLRPPASLRTAAEPVPASTLLQLAAEARVRGLLPSLGLPQWPVGPRSSERFGLLRWLARELGAPAGSTGRGFAGVQLGSWPRDLAGIAPAMLEDFEPHAFLLRSGETGPAAAAGLRALHGADGGVPGLDLRGVTAQFRHGFPAERFPAGVLPVAAGDGPDWVVQQGLDFVRTRRHQGGALWWRMAGPGELSSELAAYARGIAQEGLRAAVAMPLAATGQLGTRAAAAAVVGLPAAQLGATCAMPAATVVLQNNWLRLAGSGGALDYDAEGLARFDRPGTLRLAAGWLTTRLFGTRPDGAAVLRPRCDLLAPGQRPAGGFGPVVAIAAGALVDRRLPQRLQAAAAPEWPAAVHVELELTTGCHTCELTVVAETSAAALVVRLDGTTLVAVPCPEPGTPVTTTVPLHVARAGNRRLELAHLCGGPVAIQACAVQRTGDLAAEAFVDTAAGALAQLGERSASSGHQERVSVRALADLPGFVMRWHCERAARNLQVERTFALPGYVPWVGAGVVPEAGADGSRTAVALRAESADLPDVLLVVLRAQRHDRVTAMAGQVVWASAPETGAVAALGVLLLPRSQSRLWLPHAAVVLRALDQPLAADLGAGGELTVPGDLPFAWPRLVQVQQRAGLPFAVCVDGWWCWRGAAPGPEGSDWLPVWSLPGQVTRVRTGPALLGTTRPGPGSAGVLALQAVESQSVTACVLQPSRLGPPAVVLAAEPGAVWLDGRPWAYHDGATVFLPDRVGTYRITSTAPTGVRTPTVVACSARLRECHYDGLRRELVLVADSDPERPFGLPYTARISGPPPRSVEGGEVIAPNELRWPDAAAEAKAAAHGVTIRFRAGVTRILYGNDA